MTGWESASKNFALLLDQELAFLQLLLQPRSYFVLGCSRRCLLHCTSPRLLLCQLHHFSTQHRILHLDLTYFVKSSVRYLEFTARRAASFLIPTGNSWDREAYSSLLSYWKRKKLVKLIGLKSFFTFLKDLTALLSTSFINDLKGFFYPFLSHRLLHTWITNHLKEV